MPQKPIYEELEKRVRELEDLMFKGKPTVGTLLGNRRFLADLIENSGTLIVIKDCEGKNLLVNRKWEEVTGLNREFVIGKTDDMLFPAEIARQFRKNDLRVIESGTMIETEEVMEIPSGSRYFISIKFPLFNDEGTITGLCGIITDITQRKYAEEALRKSEKKYQSLYNNAQVALFRNSMDGKLIEINKRYAKMAGYSTVEACMAEFRPGEAWADPKGRDELISLIKEKGFVNDYETKIIRRDGAHIWILFSATIFPEQGLLEGSIVEITERKQIEEALRRSESMQRKMVANIGDVIAIISQTAINTYKSPNIERLFGWRPEDVVGKSTWDIVHPDDLESTQDFFGTLMREPNAFGTTECRYKCKDGSYRWIEFTGSNLLHDQDIRGILGNYHDIMERKQAEETLRESETRFKALHNASFGGIAIHDKGIILDCNQGLSEMTGYSVNELIGMNGLLLLAEKSRDTVMTHILAGYEKPYEAMGLHKNGTEFPVRLEARNIPYKGKNVRTVEFRDITEQKRAEEERKTLRDELIQAQKMESVGRLAGGVAHDYNNMLSVILGYTELALDKVEPSESLYDDLKEIFKAAKRSTEITRQLLAFARKQTIAPKVLDINGIVERMFKMLRHLIGEDLDIVWRPASRLWPVKIDPSQIEQILANLCVNARDAIGGVGKVTIETQSMTCDKAFCDTHAGVSAGDFVVLAVSDDGCGMDKETLDNIFEPFFTTKDVNEGTGLGLATVYGIVKQNNGFINVYSEPGKGTTFRIYLPRHAGEAMEVSAEAVQEIPHSRGEMVLLVEDESAIRKMGQMMLEKLGYQVLSAGTPDDAVRLAGEHKGEIHLLITDVVMPGMNGRELAGRLHALYPDIKTLFMSGYTANVIAHRGILEDEVQFIQKPFSMKELGIKVRATLDD
ncbi:MAG: PAS domain S-box protein [Proteobacteria bacterium]|nr:PAS domain S-box protein [Pseudomonadota bacterium]